MKSLMPKNSFLQLISNRNPDRTITHAGKHTARVTKVYKLAINSIVKVTRRVNKDGSISDIIEHRHW